MDKLITYFVLVKVWFSKGYENYYVLKINAKNEEMAEADVEEILSDWQTAESFLVEKISKTPMKLHSWNLDCRVIYRRQLKPVNHRFKVRAPDEETAEKTGLDIIRRWPYVSQHQIIKIEKV